MKKQGKLELTWVGKSEERQIEPRILLVDKSRSYGDEETENLLIHGDNLVALKALEQDFAGRIKCIYIDPPYNTGEAFDEYDDGVEHSIWLQLMAERFVCLKNLLCDEGVIFVQLNDAEMHYCKVLMDEVFLRKNYINCVTLKTKNVAGASGGGEDKRLKKNVEYILIYAKDYEMFEGFNDIGEETDLFELIQDMTVQGKSWKYTSVILDKGTFVEERTVLDGSGSPIVVKKYKGLKRTTIAKLVKDGCAEREAYIGNFENIFSDTNAQTSIRTRIIDEFKELANDELLVSTYVPKSGRDKGKSVEHYYISPTIRRVIWLKETAYRSGNSIVKKDKIGTYWQGFNWNNVNKEGGVTFSGGKKPEELVQRIIELSTQPGEIVLDSFLGSGTTAAVAHKLDRRYIGIELGEHCYSLCQERLKSVVDGDQSGISRATNWEGGGGFKFLELAEPLLVKNKKLPIYQVNPTYSFEMMSEAICKLEGFKYKPTGVYHGFSSENRFIHITNEFVNSSYIVSVTKNLARNQSLLIYCTKNQSNMVLPENIEVKKIPKDLLEKCNFESEGI
jgi:adenine-specific DNA-methyltransferase